jgi:hypothetical protein
MRTEASVAPITTSPAPPHAASTRWTERLMLRLMGLPSEEQIQERMRNFRGVFARMTPEQRAFVEAWDGPDPDVLGDPNGPKRTF